jgi:hypothetical protein
VARATTGSPAAIASMTALGAWSMPLGKAKIAVPRSTCDSPPSPGRISPITAVITTVGLQDAHQVIPVRRRERVPPGDEGDDGASPHSASFQPPVMGGTASSSSPLKGTRETTRSNSRWGRRHNQTPASAMGGAAATVATRASTSKS